MKKCFLTALLLLPTLLQAQFRLAVIGSSTAAGQGATVYDSSWVGRINAYYKRSLAIVDTVHNLGVGGYTVYRGMPSSYTPPSGRPLPDTAKNVTKANSLLAGFGRNAAVIVNFPTNGYDNYTVPEILARLQTIHDSVIAAGHRCLVTTSQPRSDANFASSAVKAKLAAIKDSIINRFGIANTLNFWDGIYNPTDSSILSAYSAGDNVHLNNAGHRELFNRVLAKNIFAANPPQVGDYRSNVSPTGLWSSAASWETYTSGGWTAASTPPDSTSGVIRILAGDSIRVNLATTLDQVVVDTGAVLTFFNTATPATFTLGNGPGEDLLVYGRLYISTGGTLSGPGEIALTPNALFTLRNFGTLGVNARNEGLARTTGTGVINGATFTNNGVFQHVEFTLNLNNGATFINDDSLAMLYASDSYFGAASGSGTLVNAADGVIFKAQATGIAYVNASVAFSNFGAIKGSGQYVFQNPGSNTGSLSPGTSPGWISVNPGFFNGKSPVLRMEIAGSGPVGGGTYDSVRLSSVNTTITSISGTRLELSNTGTDPVNTVYTLISSSGTITGSFASVSLPSNFGNLTNTGSAITVRKLAANPLSLQLLDFSAESRQERAILRWNLARPEAGARMIVERSDDGQQFGLVTEMPAESGQTAYGYTEGRPGAGERYYYRLQLVDRSGTRSLSAVRELWFGDHRPEATVSPNPAGDQATIFLPRAAAVVLIDEAGRRLRKWALPDGSHPVDLSGLPPGHYHVSLRYADGTTGQLRLQRR